MQVTCSDEQTSKVLSNMMQCTEDSQGPSSKHGSALRFPSDGYLSCEHVAAHGCRGAFTRSNWQGTRFYPTECSNKLAINSTVQSMQAHYPRNCNSQECEKSASCGIPMNYK